MKSTRQSTTDARENVWGKRLRELFGELQKGERAKLAESFHVSLSTLDTWRTGQCIPGIDSLKLIAKKYDTTIDYIIGTSEVRTSDLGVHEICKRTGLTEKAYNILSEGVPYEDEYGKETVDDPDAYYAAQAINKLLSSEHGLQLLATIYKFYNYWEQIPKTKEECIETEKRELKRYGLQEIDKLALLETTYKSLYNDSKYCRLALIDVNDELAAFLNEIVPNHRKRPEELVELAKKLHEDYDIYTKTVSDDIFVRDIIEL